MKRSKFLIAVLAVALVAAVGYIYVPGYLQARANTESDKLAAGVDPSLVSANTGFALELLRELRSEDTGKNVFYSPLSVSTALSMTLDGARGSTQESMMKTLGLSGMNQVEVNAAYQDLLASLTGADAGVSLSMANSVWVDSSFQPSVNKAFSDDLSNSYAAQFYTRSFSDPATITDINSWVSGKTAGKIDKLVDSLNPEDVMVLLNAIYFKGNWSTQFDPARTAKEAFHLDGGKTSSVDMMHLGVQDYDTKYGYYAGNGYGVARLPYGRDKIAMYVFLPDTNSSLTVMLVQLNAAAMENALASASSSKRELALAMPKFKVEYGVKELNAALTKLGMDVAFDPSKADFTGISSRGGLYIDFVDHKAIIEVNEKGTEAAAATSVAIATSAHSQTPFKVDHPFLFVIRDDRSGSILFMGAITDPTQASSP